MRYTNYFALERFSGLDGLRAIAIIAVIWHHSPTPELFPMLRRGFLGVDLFFVLSGFLITTLLLREKSRSGRISLKNFWVRRILRLVPAYYFLLLSLALTYWLLQPSDLATQKLIEGLPAYALYYSNWVDPGAPNLAITWSLSTEEQFYLVWPVIQTIAPPQIATLILLFGIVFNQLINFGLLDSIFLSLFGADRSEFEILQVTFTPILLGVAIAHMLHFPRTFRVASRLFAFRHATVVFSVLLLITINLPVNDISGAPRLLVHLMMTAWLASLVMRPNGTLARMLEWRPIALVGMISYGMYLYHMWCLHFVRKLISLVSLPPTVLEFFLSMALTIGIAGVSYRLLEKPFLDLRRVFRTVSLSQTENQPSTL